MYGGEVLKFVVTHLYCTKYIEIDTFISVIQKNVSYVESHKRFLMYYGLLEMYFLNCISWFVSIILNVNALFVACTFQRQSYAVLFKCNRIFYLILGITFAN